MSPQVERRSLFDELGSRGIRLTAQRRALVEAIQEAKEHLDAGSLLELARRREPNINRATVYRTIELLKKLRLIDEFDLMHLEGEKHYYEVKTRRDAFIWPVFDAAESRNFRVLFSTRSKRRLQRKPVSRSGSQEWRLAATVALAPPIHQPKRGMRTRRLQHFQTTKYTQVSTEPFGEAPWRPAYIGNPKVGDPLIIGR